MLRRILGVCVSVTLAGLAACTGTVIDDPVSAYVAPSTAPATFASGANPATAATVFTIRSSDWLNSPEETKALIVRQCGPAFKTARVFRREDGGSPKLHPVELAVYCGDLKPRIAVYPEPGAGPLSANLMEMNTPSLAAGTGELIQLR
ncbi:MAG: hypothetical protein WCF85_08030 [Rhodospirillaceae bacterium]